MKTKKLAGKLSLNKKTVANLETQDMGHVIGGATESCQTWCFKPVSLCICTTIDLPCV